MEGQCNSFFVAYLLKLMKTRQGSSNCHRAQSISRYEGATHWRRAVCVFFLSGGRRGVTSTTLSPWKTSHCLSSLSLFSSPEHKAVTHTRARWVIPSLWGFTPVPGWCCWWWWWCVHGPPRRSLYGIKIWLSCGFEGEQEKRNQCCRFNSPFPFFSFSF